MILTFLAFCKKHIHYLFAIGIRGRLMDWHENDEDYVSEPEQQAGPDESRSFVEWILYLFPILVWMPVYRGRWLVSDMVAGVTLAAYAIPVAMAYSALASLPSQTGLYCYIFAGIVFAIFTTSKQLSVGPTAAISLMVASVAGTMAAGDSTLYAAIAAMTAGMVALICLLAWSFRLSSFVNFISQTVLIGFKAGAAISIASTQIPKLFGFNADGAHFFYRLLSFFEHLRETNLLVLLISIVSIVLLVIGAKKCPRCPTALAVVILSIIVVSLFDLSKAGVSVVGHIPAGLPKFGIPEVNMQHLEGVMELAFACFLLCYVESIAAARTFAESHDYEFDPRQELLGLGAANLVAAFFQGYPVGGGLSQSAVNDRAGARTPLSLVFASLTLLGALFFLTGFLQNLPEAVLAAIVLVAVSGFVKISDFKYLWSISRSEFYIALVAFLSVLLLGILKGVMISAIVSILFLLRLLAKPHIALLGRIPGTIRFSDAERHTKNELFPGLFLFRVEAPLLYFNVETIIDSLMKKIASQTVPVKLVVCDLSTSPYIDAAGAKMLDELVEKLEVRGIEFKVAEAHAEVREILRATGFSESLGGVSRHIALSDIVEDFERDQARLGSH